MPAERTGQKMPLFFAEPKPSEERGFATTDGMAKVEKVVFDLLLGNDYFLDMRQFHSIARADAPGMSRFTRKEYCGLGGLASFFSPLKAVAQCNYRLARHTSESALSCPRWAVALFGGFDHDTPQRRQAD
jgi:hypothetical protein